MAAAQYLGRMIARGQYALALKASEALWTDPESGHLIEQRRQVVIDLMRTYGVHDELLIDGILHLLREVTASELRESFVRTLEEMVLYRASLGEGSRGTAESAGAR